MISNSIRTKLFSLLAAILATIILTVITSKYGIAISPDSACYISIAENINNGKGLAIYDFEPAVAWPPLYLALLAIGKYLNLDYHAWARIIGVILFALLIYIVSNELISRLSGRFLKIVSIAALLFSVPLIYVAKFAWSETLFILFVTLFLFKLENSYNSHSVKNVLTLAVLAALACLTRYVGVTLVIFYLLYLLFSKIEFRKKLKLGSIFSAVSLAPLAIWLCRNFNLTGTLTGERGGSATSFVKNFYHAADSFSLWFFPAEIPADTRITLTGVIALIGAAYYIRKNLHQNGSGQNSRTVLINFGFSLTYVTYLIAVSSLVAFDQINHRLLAPVYIPLLVMALTAAGQLCQSFPTWKSPVKIVLNVLAALWLCNLTYFAYSETKMSLKDGAGGYSTTFWQRSALARFLAENPPQGKVYCNFPDALYTLSNLRASMSPRMHQYRAAQSPTNDIEKLKAELQTLDFAYLAWFTEAKRGYQFPPESLQTAINLTVERQLNDGTLYRVFSLPKSGP